jgi:hypothetical protein
VCYNKYVIKRDYKIKFWVVTYHKKGIDTMAIKKMTQKDYFNEILALPNLPDNLREFVEGRIEALNKKAGKSAGKPTATQIANEGIKSTIIENMVVGEKYTISNLIKSDPALADFTNQKVSALVRQLIAEGKVERTEVKGVAYFSLAE